MSDDPEQWLHVNLVKLPCVTIPILDSDGKPASATTWQTMSGDQICVKITPQGTIEILQAVASRPPDEKPH